MPSMMPMSAEGTAGKNGSEDANARKIMAEMAKSLFCKTRAEGTGWRSSVNR